MTKKKIAIIASIVIAAILLIAGVSYAYYSANVKEVNKTETVIKTDELSITFTGTQEITAENMIPGDSFTKKFTVENTSGVAVTYNVYMQNITNEFNEDLVYVLSDENGVVVAETSLPETNADKTYIKTGITIAAGATKEYSLRVEFKYLDTPQNDYQNKTFNATLGIDTTPIDIVKVINEKITFTNLTEETTITKKFEVRNLSEAKQIYDLKLSDITNDYNTDVKFNLIKNDEEVLTEQTITGSEMVLLEGQEISANTTDYYEIEFKLTTTVGMNDTKIMLLADEIKKFDATAEVEFTKVETEKSGASILSIVAKEKSNEGIYNYNVNGETYSVHYYAFDGDQTWSENKTFGDENDIATANEYAKNMVIVKVDGDLTIDSGITVGPVYSEYGGPKGFMLYVTGTLTNNGTIDNSHGAKAEGQNVYLWKNADGTYEYVPAVGGSGGTAVSASRKTPGITGTPGEGRQTGGGGSGANYKGAYTSGAGTAGTSYSGGTGGASIKDNEGSTSGTANGGAGGVPAGIGGGGAGNPGGKTGNTSRDGSNGTGGLLIIYANDYINNSTISAHGANGSSNSGGGGSSGGGSINIFYKNTKVEGTTNVLGGSTSTSVPGGAGGAGTVTYTQIN